MVDAANGDRYLVGNEKDVITGKFETIGFVTSVAESNKLGTTVAIAILNSSQKHDKVFYRNLHWNHWRVACVKVLASTEMLF